MYVSWSIFSAILFSLNCSPRCWTTAKCKKNLNCFSLKKRFFYCRVRYLKILICKPRFVQVKLEQLYAFPSMRYRFKKNIVCMWNCYIKLHADMTIIFYFICRPPNDHKFVQSFYNTHTNTLGVLKYILIHSLTHCTYIRLIII
jgi:hypothetical protein